MLNKLTGTKRLLWHFIKSRYFYLFFYAALSLSILGPLLLPGAVLTLDMRYGPNMSVANQFFGLDASGESLTRLPLYSLITLVSIFVPFWVWQKALFFLVFFFMGVNVHRLVGRNSPGGYFAGLLYTVNPFTYVRFLSGQFVVLTVYAFTPLAVKVFFDFLETPNNNNAIRVALVTTLVGVMYEYGFPLLAFVYLIILAVKLLSAQNRSYTMTVARTGSLSLVVFLLLNTFWLVPLLTAHGTILENIGYYDLVEFAPAPTSQLGVMFDVASMYGFWRGGYTYTKDILPVWWVFFAFILFLAVYGYLSFSRDKKIGWVIKPFVFIGIAGFVMAVGAGSQLTRPAFEWLWQHVPYFNVFRDSQKFTGLLCLTYAFLGSLAVDRFTADFKQHKTRYSHITVTIVLILSMITPVIYSFNMFGFNGQLGTTDYPREWYQVNDYLNQDKSDFNVLFLPWHEFMDYSWLPNNDKRLGNPARQFFNKPVIQGDNIEMPGVYTESVSHMSNYVTFLLGKSKEINNFGELLSPLNVKYILLVNEADYKQYDFLFKQNDLTVALSLPGITVLENEHSIDRIYGVSSLVYIKNLDEYLELSKTQDVMERLYIIGTGTGEDGSETQNLDFTKESQVDYRTGKTDSKYTVFTLPQNANTNFWTYNGKQALLNLGFMPSFLSATAGGEIVYQRFYSTYLPGYIVSLIALSGIIVYLLSPYSRKLYKRKQKKLQ